MGARHRLSVLKQSFSWWSFAGGLGDRDDRAAAESLVAVAAQIGYAGVEMPPEWLWDTIRGHGMAVATVVGHQSLSDGMNRTANHDRIAGEIADNLQKAAANGIPNLIVFSGNPRGLKSATTREPTRQPPFCAVSRRWRSRQA